VLAAVLRAPDEVRSRARLEVTLELTDVPDGNAYATIAAVDLGALTLTGFDPPDPIGHYFGQRRLGVAIRDLYGRLIDARAGALGEVRSGGGADMGEGAGSAPLPAEDVLALFRGPVVVEGGRATVAFELPAFQGTVRVMAVVWTETAVGQAHADVLVRDPVVVQPSLPRFLTPGDTSRLRLELTHLTGAAGEMALEVDGHGLGDVPRGVTLAEGGRAVLDLPLRPTEVGDHAYRVALTTPDGERIVRELRLSVPHRPRGRPLHAVHPGRRRELPPRRRGPGRLPAGHGPGDPDRRRGRGARPARADPAAARLPLRLHRADRLEPAAAAVGADHGARSSGC
jgi:alpha-2-macroglobulin